MSDIFYAVQVTYNGRSGCYPTTFKTKLGADEFVECLMRMDTEDVKVEISMYEVKEIRKETL